MNIAEMKYLNEGECAEIYEVDANRVLKLGKTGWSREILYQEYLNGKRIGDSNIPAPKIYDFVEIEGRFGYTMDKLKGETCLDLIGKHPLRISEYAKRMASIHAQIHSVKAPKELPALVDCYIGHISAKKSISDKIMQLLLRDIKTFGAEGECRICHGDFHPINILVEGDRYSVIDWVLAAQGNPEADVAGTYLIASVYSSNLGKKNILMRMIAALGGRLFAKIYLKEYIAITKMNKEKILRWIPIRAATYVDVGLPANIDKVFCKIMEKYYK